MHARIRFSVRTLLVSCTCICVVLALVVHSYQRNDRIIRRIETTTGAYFSYVHEWTAGGYLPDAIPPGDPLLKSVFGEFYAFEPAEIELFRWDENKACNMRPERFTDEEARLLSAFDHLTWIVLKDTQLTDDGLMYFARIPDLERLDLSSPHLTEDGARRFGTLRPDVMGFIDQDGDTICFGAVR